MGVRSHASPAEAPPRIRSRGPSLASTVLVVVSAFALLVASGRALPAPPSEGLAALLLAGALRLASFGLLLDATGAALVGKVLAAFFAALAAGALFSATARRHGPSEGRWAGFSLALGTTLAAAAQGWSGEPAAACAVAFAVLPLVRADQEDRALPAAIAGLPLGLAVAFQPSCLALVACLLLFVVVRFRAPGVPVLAWAAPGLLLALGGSLWATGTAPAATPTALPQPPPSGAGMEWLALLASPARGILLFAPVALVALVGAVRALRRTRHRLWDQAEPSRLLPAACLVAGIAHVAWLGVAGGWDSGPFWGPRLVAPAWPPLLLFLPEGFAVLRIVATLLVVASVGVQALGVLSYDGRWDRLHGPAAGARRASTWDFAKGPIAFHARERSARVALPTLEGGRLGTRERTLAPRGGAGSFVSFARLPPSPTGVEATFDGLRFEGESRFEAGALVLSKEGDGLAFRVREGARPRRLEIRIVGSGQGRIGIAESGLAATRWRDRAVSGPFRLKLPYVYADSGGPDIRVVLRAGGPVSIESMALVPPSEPENVLRLP